MMYPNLKKQPTKKLIEEAARNLLIGDIEVKRIGEFIDFIRILLDKVNGKEDNYDKSRYDLINAGIEFFDKVRPTYGIFDPLEAFIAWLAIMEEANPKFILERDYKIEYFRSWAEAVETRFLEKPSENMQRKMGLPIVNCAITKTNMHIEENMDFSRILSKRIRPGYQHFILLDSSVTMRNYFYCSNKRISGYLSAILLEILYKADKALVFLNDNIKVVRKISIESKQDKRKFWIELDRRLFSSEVGYTNSLFPILEIIASKEYKNCKANNEKMYIDIITDKDFSDFSNKITDIIEKINLEGVKINVFLLQPKSLFLGDKESNLKIMLSKIKKKSLFLIDKDQLVWCDSKDVL